MPDELRQAMQEVAVLLRQQATAQQAATKPRVADAWAKVREESNTHFAQRRENSRKRFAQMRESCRRQHTEAFGTRRRSEQHDRAFQQSLLAELRRQNDLLDKVLTRPER